MLSPSEPNMALKGKLLTSRSLAPRYVDASGVGRVIGQKKSKWLYCIINLRQFIHSMMDMLKCAWHSETLLSLRKLKFNVYEES